MQIFLNIFPLLVDHRLSFVESCHDPMDKSLSPPWTLEGHPEQPPGYDPIIREGYSNFLFKISFQASSALRMDLVLSFCNNFLLSRGTLSCPSFWDFHWCNSAMLCTKVCFSDVDFNGWLSLPSVVPTNFLPLAARCDVCHHSWRESIRKMLCRSKQGWSAGVAFGD